MKMYKNRIGGKWIEGVEATPNINPSNTKEVIGEYTRVFYAAVKTRCFPA